MQTELCGKCGAEIDPSRRVDFSLKTESEFVMLASLKKLRDPRPGQIGPTEHCFLICRFWLTFCNPSSGYCLVNTLTG